MGYYRTRYYAGGGFLSSVKNALGGVARIASAAAPIVGAMNPGLGAALGAGGMLGGKLLGGATGGGIKAMPGGAIIGGALALRDAVPAPLNKPLLDVVPFALKGLAKGVGMNVENGGAPRKKYRHMNPLNPAALRRADRRIDAAKKLIRKLGLLPVAKKAECRARRAGKC